MGTVLHCLQEEMILHSLQIMLVVFLILVFYEVVVGLTLDSGGGGVYDSPLVTNQLGGRSGVQGLEALQDHNDPMPHGPHPSPTINHQDMSHKLGKKMVELSPLVVENVKSRTPRQFSRFLAVP